MKMFSGNAGASPGSGQILGGARYRGIRPESGKVSRASQRALANFGQVRDQRLFAPKDISALKRLSHEISKVPTFLAQM